MAATEFLGDPQGEPGQGGPERGPRGGPGMRRGMRPPGGPGLLLSPEVQRELGLSADQKEEVLALVEKNRPPRPDNFQGGPGEGPDGGPNGGPPGGPNGKAMRDKFEAAVKGVLTESQLTRWHEIELQAEGSHALLRPDVAEKLGITASQRNKIAALMRGMGQRGPGHPPMGGADGRGPGGPDDMGGPGGPPGGDEERGGPPGGGPENEDNANGGPPMGGPGGGGPGRGGPGRGGPGMMESPEMKAKVKAILTPEQQKKWQEMQGKPMRLGPPPRRGN